MKNQKQLDAHLKKILPHIQKTAVEAGKYISKKFGKYESLQIKKDSSLVTEVDQTSESIVIKGVKKICPQDEILGEESGLNQTPGKSSFRWHIDPLDGTTNFVHGFPMFCVSIGLEYFSETNPTYGTPVLGVIYQPMTKDLYFASHGHGAFKNKNRILVSKTKKLSQSLLSTGFSLSRAKYFKQEMSTFAKVNQSSHAVRRTGSAAMDLTFVTTGQFDGFWEYGLKTWDVAAGLALLKEAGGKYSQVNGTTYSLGCDSIVATNQLIHKELLYCLNGKK